MALQEGAVVLSSFLSAAFDRIATPEFLDLFRQQNFNHGLIGELKRKMIYFNSLLNDAEEKQFYNPEVKNWLMELKEAAYDAEDVMDEIEYEAQRCKALQDGDSSSSSGDLLTKEIEENLKRILVRLESLIKKRVVLEKCMGERITSANRETTSLPDNLRELEDLFARHACVDVNSSANRELQAIGKEIVRKCGGLTLAAKALGGVLKCQTEAKKWKEVLNSKLWDAQIANILPALAISYIHLPSHQRRCFAYCAMFPQNYEFQKEKLVALWMSEGFLVQQNGNQSLEEIGEKYFEDLVSISFFQHSSNSGGKPCFVMDDLVHDLARFVSGQLCSRLEGETSWNFGKGTRHLSYERARLLSCERAEQDVWGILDLTSLGIHGTPFLRSFVLAQQMPVYCGFRCIAEKVFRELLPAWKQLPAWMQLPAWKQVRVLFLSCNRISYLPDSIGNLKHMRQLDLSQTSITKLPEAVTALFNLEILILRECGELVELPANMARLINLCQLDLRGAERLKEMPPEMGKLKKLSKLSDFVVGDNGSSIEELGHLHCLRGQLCIRGLENVKYDRRWKKASEAILNDKVNLKVLQLEWKGELGVSSQPEQVLDRLQPHSHIECITILGYGFTQFVDSGQIRFPRWVGDKSSKVKKMVLSGCKNRICLPPLGQLASLEELSIDGYEELKDIGMEFYGNLNRGEKPFSSLKRLKFVGMKNWGEWSSKSGEFPVLEELELHDCPKLKSVPSRFPRLERLQIKDCHKVERISLGTFSNLKELVLRSCYNLESLWPWTIDPSFSSPLTSLTIRGCSKLTSLPLLPSLEELELHSCPKLMSSPTDLTRLKRLRIEDCPDLDFENLLNSACATLETLRICRCSKFVSFPGGLLAPNLKEMDLSGCGNLKSLPQGMHSCFPSLEKLSISDCPEIESFPEGGLLSKLQSLEISECKKLDFIVGENGGSIIEELGNIHDLRGEISIRGLENVKNDRDVSEPILKDKVNLKMLKLSWNGNNNDSMQVKQVLERMQPHMQIEYMWIQGYGGTEFPNWVGDISFSKLKEMRMDGCNNCISLPPLGQLASLEKLSITCTELMVIGPEFYGECEPREKPFSSLKTLEFRGMKNWGEWRSCDGAFPVLEELELCDCPELMSVPSDLPGLKRLRISGCGQPDFENFFYDCLVLETIDIRGSAKVKCISLGNFPFLRVLHVTNCSNLESLGSTETTTTTWTSASLFYPSLTSLTIRRCRQLKSFPTGLDAPNLKSVYLSGCRNLEGMHSYLPSLEKLSIICCPKIESLPYGRLPSSLSSLYIKACPLLQKRCMGEYWPMIQDIPDLEIVPGY